MCTGLEFAALASFAVSAAGQVQQGIAARDAAKTRSRLISLEAERKRATSKAEARDFRRKANRLLATQRARFAGSGVSFEGTPVAVGGDTAAEAELRAQRILVSGVADANLLEFEADIERRRGEDAFIAGLTKAGTTLLTGASRVPFGSGSSRSIPTSGNLPTIRTNPGERLAGRT